MAKQRLSPKARAAKKARDLQVAKTPRRTAMKAENQRKRRAAQKAGKSVAGKDYDHSRGKFVSKKTNRSATKTTNNTMGKGGIKAAIKKAKSPKKPVKMTPKHKAAGKKYMAKARVGINNKGRIKK